MTSPDYDHDNIFAKILRGEIPCFKVHENDDILVFMDIMPRGNGHCLVIPKKPVRNMLDADDETLGKVYATAKRIGAASLKAFDADGVTIQQFNESAGGQEVFHLHMHVIPRHEGIKMGKPGIMGDMEEIKANSEKLTAALEN